VLSSSSVRTRQPSDTLRPTRDILVVRGILNKKDTITILVNHWPSRIGGTEKSEDKRIFAAATVRYICDSLNKLYPGGQILAMGDFNDEPTNNSIRSLTRPDNAPSPTPYFENMMDSIKASGDGTHYYKKEKSCLDQILVHLQARLDLRGSV